VSLSHYRRKDASATVTTGEGLPYCQYRVKFFCSVLLNRLQKEVDAVLREEQAGFRTGRNRDYRDVSEQILTLRNIIQQCHKWQKPLHINYIDFKKAFDSIHRDSLWKILELYGIPAKYINIFKALYRD